MSLWVSVRIPYTCTVSLPVRVLALGTSRDRDIACPLLFSLSRRHFGNKADKGPDSTAPLNKCRAQDLQLSLGPGKITCHFRGVAEKKVGSMRIAREGGIEVAGADFFMPFC